MLNQVRYCWYASIERAERAEFVIAVVRGVAKGVFKAEKWLEASDEEFKAFDEYPVEKRIGFRGDVAAEEFWKLYVGESGKRLSKKLRHTRNPIRYTYK